MNDKDFKDQVIDRLARIETKLDTVCNTVSVNSNRITTLETESNENKGSTQANAKLAKIAVSAISVLASLVLVVSLVRGWW
jgi:phage terminase large subunit GpA-like protein